MRVARLAAAAGLALLAAACSRSPKPEDCRTVQEYQASQSGPLLQTPPDITRSATAPLTIPDARGDLDQATIGCLERPPPYFDRPPAAGAGPGGALPAPGGSPPPPAR